MLVYFRTQHCLIVPLIIIIVLLIQCGRTNAMCESKMLNFITDVAWTGVFPIKIAGMSLFEPDDPPDARDPSGNIFCFCSNPPRIGTVVSFWEPFAIIETVKDPWCFPSFFGSTGGSPVSAGSSLPSPESVWGQGGTDEHADGNPSSFANVHYYRFPVWVILNLFTDLPCLDQGAKFDLIDFTEVWPDWRSDLMAGIMNPEALLFANPIAQMACIGDAIAAGVGLPRDEFFWCLGNWGSAYPMAGFINNGDTIEANAALAARFLYKRARLLVLWDTNLDVCSKGTPWPILRKSNYRLQMARPTVMSKPIPIGRPGIMWEFNKNPAFLKGQDNFVWIVFRRVSCCLSYTPGL